MQSGIASSHFGRMKQSHRTEILRDGFETTRQLIFVLESNTNDEHAGHGNADNPDDGQGHVG